MNWYLSIGINDAKVGQSAYKQIVYCSIESLTIEKEQGLFLEK